MLAWVAGGLIRRVWRLSRRAMWACPAQEAARWGGLVAAAGYAVMAGGAVPAQRTVLMLAVLTLLRAGGQRWPGPLILLACAAAVVLWDPWALLQPGFWLSFVAVGLLMLSDAADAPPTAPGRWLAWAGQPGDAADTPDAAVDRAPTATGRWRRRVGAALAPAVRGWWRGQWVASVGLAPWTLLFFQQVSVVGLLANALAVPVLALGVTPLALAGVLWSPLWTPAAWAVEALMQALAAMAAWPAAEAFAPVAPPLVQALALVGALLVVVPMPWPLRGLGLCLMLPMMWPAVERPAVGEFDLLAADVGQGNAVLVRTATRHLLYDTGPVYSPESDAGERVLVPLLRAWGSGRLDLLVLSHRDSDHTGGAAAVLRQPGAVRVLGSLERGHPLRRMAPFQPCAAGQRWDWDGVRFEVLHPRARAGDAGHAGHTGHAGEVAAERSNAASCVLRVSNGRRVLLLTGDIERDQEADILQRALEAGDLHRLRADVMLVPHHGSRTSSSPAWLRAVQPHWGLVQSGHANRYGHPAPEVLSRLRSHDIGLIRTDQCGAWHWRSADASSECSRQTGRRYWHAPTWPSTD
jgi:competence protein ComEC